MNKTHFKHVFFRGLGSALIELQSCGDPQKFSDIVLYGCVHNTTYDIQCEGDRGWYLYQAAKLAGDKEAVETAVIQRFFKIREDEWLFNQLTSILYRFAADGGKDARAALYQQYENMLAELSPERSKIRGMYRTYPRRDMFDWLCVWLTSLDGWGAFKRILRDVCETLLPKDEDCFFSEWFYDNSKDKFGKKRIDDYLRKQSGQSPNIRIYYEKAKAWDTYVYSEQPIPTFEEVIAAIDGQEFQGRGIVMRFARNASSEELEKLATAAINETDAKIQFELLWPFRRFASFSFPEEFLLRLSASDDDSLRDVAFDIMGRNPSEKTRQLALSLIRSGNDVENGISLLAKNLRPEDEAVLCEAVKMFPVRRDGESWHSAFMAAKDGLKAMRGKPKTDILEYIYHNTFCGSCREHVVWLMHKKKALPADILLECQYDSYSDTRAFAERVIKYNK